MYVCNFLRQLTVSCTNFCVLYPFSWRTPLVGMLEFHSWANDTASLCVFRLDRHNFTRSQLSRICPSKNCREKSLTPRDFLMYNCKRTQPTQLTSNPPAETFLSPCVTSGTPQSDSKSQPFQLINHSGLPAKKEDVSLDLLFSQRQQRADIPFSISRCLLVVFFLSLFLVIFALYAEVYLWESELYRSTANEVVLGLEFFLLLQFLRSQERTQRPAINPNPQKRRTKRSNSVTSAWSTAILHGWPCQSTGESVDDPSPKFQTEIIAWPAPGHNLQERESSSAA